MGEVSLKEAQAPMLAAVTRSKKGRLFVIALLVIITLLVFIRVVIWASSAQGRFALATGLSCPKVVSLIDTEDNHSVYNGDGEFYLIMECDPETTHRWLSSRPFWGLSQWHRGPVPAEIGFHCHFGASETMGYSTIPDGSEEYFGGSAEIREVLSSPKFWYAAEDKCPSIPYHQGRLLVVDPESGRVWYSDWKW